MAITFTCQCGKQLQVQDDYAGKRVKCPDCEAVLEAPTTSTAVQGANGGITGPPLSPSPKAKRRRRFDDDDDDEDQYGPPLDGPSRVSRKAVASLILGVMSLCCLIFTGIPAIILAIQSLGDIKRSREQLSGRGLAIAGIVLSIVCPLVMLVLLAPFLVAVGLMLPATQKVREAAARMQSSNNLKQLSIAMINYHDKNGRLPPAALTDKAGKPLLSWRVAVLPFLGDPQAEALYQRFNLDEPWDSPNNLPLAQQMPQVFRAAAAPPSTPGDHTHYRVFVGPQTPFANPNGAKMTEITDGTSNTILIVEAADPVLWTKPEELDYAPTKPLPRLGGLSPNGFNAAFADGSIRFIPSKAKEQALRSAITATGAETIDFSDLGW